jgi:peptidoglycan hydrolase CwlO-like protein
MRLKTVILTSILAAIASPVFAADMPTAAPVQDPQELQFYANAMEQQREAAQNQVASAVARLNTAYQQIQVLTKENADLKAKLAEKMKAPEKAPEMKAPEVKAPEAKSEKDQNPDMGK